MRRRPPGLEVPATLFPLSPSCGWGSAEAGRSTSPERRATLVSRPLRHCPLAERQLVARQQCTCGAAQHAPASLQQPAAAGRPAGQVQCSAHHLPTPTNMPCTSCPARRFLPAADERKSQRCGRGCACMSQQGFSLKLDRSRRREGVQYGNFSWWYCSSCAASRDVPVGCAPARPAFAQSSRRCFPGAAASLQHNHVPGLCSRFFLEMEDGAVVIELSSLLA
jgi:hypothetical protein